MRSRLLLAIVLAGAALAVVPTVASASDAATARATVRDYYVKINARRFAYAWSYLDPVTQRQFGGFRSWKSGYRTMISTRPLRVRVTRVASAGATVAVRIESVDRDACGRRITRVFAGTWHTYFSAKGVRLETPHIRQVSGPLLRYQC